MSTQNFYMFVLLLNLKRRMIDMVGLKVFTEISRILIERFPDRFYKSKLIPVLQNANREGNSAFSVFRGNL